MTDLDLDFYSIIARTWTPEEAGGLTAYAERCEDGHRVGHSWPSSLPLPPTSSGGE